MQVQKQLLQELGHEPTPEEVAIEMDLPVERVQAIMKDGPATDFPAKPRRRFRRYELR